jgi:hypothetical protein
MVMTPNPDIEKILEEFDEGVANNYRGQDPYWPDWDGVKSFLRQSLLSYGKAQREQAYREVYDRLQESILHNRHCACLEGIKQQLRERFLHERD